MKYVEDNNLTENQNSMKWCLYCELEYEPDSDIKAVLDSILKDMPYNEEP